MIRAIGDATTADQHKIIVNKSTVPIGTSKMTLDLLSRQVNSKDKDIEEIFTVVSMPEFLAEGQAIQCLMNPDRVVIGTPSNGRGDKAFKLLSSLFPKDVKIINTRNASSELGKLMANAMLA